ncbi:MAG: alpha/beta hydrolase [Pseudomonadota bacterium]
MQQAVLSDGMTAFEPSGEGPLVVLAHGLSTPSIMWVEMIPLLHQAGFSTLTYDIYGRGESSMGQGRFDEDVFLRQLFELLDYLDISEPVHLCGYSMGGAIATCAVVAAPHRFKSLSLLAPAGLVTVLGGWWRHLRSPIWGQTYGRLFGAPRLRRETWAQAVKLRLDPELLKKQIAATRKMGAVDAMRKSILQFPLSGLQMRYAALADLDIPTYAIWGAFDAVVPIAAYQEMTTLTPNARHLTLDTGTHAMPYTHHKDITDALVGFFRTL